MSSDAPAQLRDVVELVRQQSTITPGGYAAIAVADARAPIEVAAFVRGQRQDPPPRTSVASITKPITATAVMQLVQAGRVNLDDPVAAHVAEFDAQQPAGTRDAVPVTIRHVLSHTSGLADIPEDEVADQTADGAAMLQAACRQRLRYRPGDVWAYAR